MITAKKIWKWETSDGKEHSTIEMANQHIAFVELEEMISDRMYLRADVEPADIINFITSNRSKIRAYLDSCDAMERAAMEVDNK